MAYGTTYLPWTKTYNNENEVIFHDAFPLLHVIVQDGQMDYCEMVLFRGVYISRFYNLAMIRTAVSYFRAPPKMMFHYLDTLINLSKFY
jgi:hypothetical protein